MKHLFVALGIFLVSNSYSQAPANNYAEHPNAYNLFITSSNISWAARFTPEYSFLDHSYKKYASIYDYLIDNQKQGIIKSYLPKNYNDDYDSSINNLQKEKEEYYVDTNYSKLDQSDLFVDSLKELQFDQILTVEDHILKSHIIAAAPEFPVVTSLGVYLGNTYKALCCLNKNNSSKAKNDLTVFLKDTYQYINEDTPWHYRTTIIKKSYDMNLITTLWYDLSKGYNKLIDLRNDKPVIPNQIWNYPIEGFIKQDVYDSTGNLSGYQMLRSASARGYLTKLGIHQLWYYDATKNIFFDKIDYVDIYTSTMNNGIEKRFKIIFNKS